MTDPREAFRQRRSGPSKEHLAEVKAFHATCIDWRTVCVACGSARTGSLADLARPHQCEAPNGS